MATERFHGWRLAHLKLCLIILAICLMLCLPIPWPGDDGAYNTLSRLYWCKTPAACLHEQGHQLDQRLEWASQTDAFGEALEMAVIVELASGNPTKTTMWLLEFPGLFRPAQRPFWNAKAEIYAELYSKANGTIENLPESFQEFYR